MQSRPRAFDPDRDYAPMVDLIWAVNAHDGETWFPTPASLAIEWGPSPSFDPPRDARVVEADGRFIAAANTHWREKPGKVVHVVEIWVHPDFRRRGLGRDLLAWAEARAREAREDGSGGPRDLPHFFNGGSDLSNAAGVAFAESARYERVRYGFEMRRNLADPIPPDPPMPAGLEVRPVLPEHHRAIWDADTEAFRDHWEASRRHEADFVEFFSHPDVDTSLWQVAWAGDEVGGSVVNGIYPDENAKLGIENGWLDHVSVRRRYRKRGLAYALIVRSLRVLRERGMDWASLGVDAENPTGALELYQRAGFTAHRQWVTYRKPF